MGNCSSNSTGTPSCCAAGLYCINSKCATDNMGSSCTATSQCLPSATAGLGYTCAMNGSSGICTYLGYPGDSCSNSSQCGFNLPCNNNSICAAPTQGQSCATIGLCAFGLTCKLVNASLICAPEGQNGTACGATNPCYPGYFCHNGFCLATFSIGSGQACTKQDQCSSGYDCGTNGTCTAVTTSFTTCTATANCSSGQLCVCSEFSGNSYCLGGDYDPCNAAHVTFRQCLDTNNCTSQGDAPNSCSYKNCYSSFKKSQSCGCSTLSDLYSTCGYSPYCGGFPVWAIIVIIIVIIVLILAVVLVVFFLMRRRRQYDSI